MKQPRVFIPTMRDVPSKAEARGHHLLLRAGLTKQSTNGTYSYLPLATRVLNNTTAIVRQGMGHIDSAEILVLALQQAELWEESGRWDTCDPELMRLQDRHGRQSALDPAHEELATSIVRNELKSYRQLSTILFQIQSKFCDEKKPRFNLLRGHEFIMRDTYSFHTNEASLDQTYQDMYRAYSRAFERVGISVRPVVADLGAIGGSRTHEFMTLSTIDEDTVAYGRESDYAANIEKAEVVYGPDHKHTTMRPIEKIETPNIKAAQELADFLGRSVGEIIKTVIFRVNGEYIMVLVRGHHKVNDIKLESYFDIDDVELATQDEIVNLVGANPGSLGPIIDKEIKICADNLVQDLNNLTVEANKGDYYLIDVNVGRDFNVDEYGDFRFISEGKKLNDGSGVAYFAEGVEVSQVFKLSTKYSGSMNATFLGNQGEAQPLIIGCYGIGISRTLSVIVEQDHDDNGIVWPKSVTLFDLHLISTDPKKDDQRELADALYTEFSTRFDVLCDDCQECAGVKFNNTDLIGSPLRIVVGKRASEGIVEVKERLTGDNEEVHIDDLIIVITNKYDDLK